MPAPPTAELTEALYDAAIAPEGWPQVMALLGRRYHTRVDAFYFLDQQAKGLRPVSIRGVSPAFYSSFSACFYTDDNPCLRSAPLHRPGAVRTDQQLLAYFADAHVLRRSTYYNEWMRPQELLHTMGATPLVEEGLVLNLSLLRGADRGAFRAGEVREFSVLARHLQRALRLSLRMDTLRQGQALSARMLDGLSQALLAVDGRCRLLHANAQAEAWLRQRHGLLLRDGVVCAADAADAQVLGALVAACAQHPARLPPAGLAPVALRSAAPRPPLLLQAMPLRPAATPWAPPRSAVLLCLSEPAPVPAMADALAQRYALTPAELRLARALADGAGLRAAAERAGMAYETARWYIKILFDKTGTRRQAELVRLLQTGA